MSTSSDSSDSDGASLYKKLAPAAKKTLATPRTAKPSPAPAVAKTPPPPAAKAPPPPTIPWARVVRRLSRAGPSDRLALTWRYAGERQPHRWSGTITSVVDGGVAMVWDPYLSQMSGCLTVPMWPSVEDMEDCEVISLDICGTERQKRPRSPNHQEQMQMQQQPPQLQMHQQQQPHLEQMQMQQQLFQQQLHQQQQQPLQQQPVYALQQQQAMQQRNPQQPWDDEDEEVNEEVPVWWAATRDADYDREVSRVPLTELVKGLRVPADIAEEMKAFYPHVFDDPNVWVTAIRAKFNEYSCCIKSMKTKAEIDLDISLIKELCQGRLGKRVTLNEFKNSFSLMSRIIGNLLSTSPLAGTSAADDFSTAFAKSWAAGRVDLGALLTARLTTKVEVTINAVSPATTTASDRAWREQMESSMALLSRSVGSAPQRYQPPAFRKGQRGTNNRGRGRGQGNGYRRN
jgi:hypothetical protein